MNRLSGPSSDAVRILGESIRAGRLRRGWSVAALAERVGVTSQTITRIERGAPGVAIGTVFEAAHLAGVELYGEHRDRVGRTVANELALLPHADVLAGKPTMISEPLNSLFVWIWLPGETEPVVAGRLDRRGDRFVFSYGRSYIDRPGAVSDLPA